MKQLIGISLMLIGVIPGIVWLCFAGYMFYIGPRIGWISDEFIRIEGVSLLWGLTMFVGIGVMALGDSIRRCVEATK